jgi:hypothetical protein
LAKLSISSKNHDLVTLQGGSFFFVCLSLGLIHAWITLQVFRNYCELPVNYCELPVNYCELPWITVNCLNYSELLGITWIFYYIFLLGYRFFNWAIIFFCWVIIFLLGQLDITTGLNCELLWITLYCCELLWIGENTLSYCEITVNCWNYFELHWITTLLNCSWRKY